MNPLNYLKAFCQKVSQLKPEAIKEAVFTRVYSTAITIGLKANTAMVIGELVVGVVMLFVGLFMISIVATAAAINNSSAFYATYRALVVTTGTIFTVLGLVIIVVALSVAIQSLKTSFA